MTSSKFQVRSSTLLLFVGFFEQLDARVDRRGWAGAGFDAGEDFASFARIVFCDEDDVVEFDVAQARVGDGAAVGDEEIVQAVGTALAGAFEVGFEFRRQAGQG